MTSSEPRKPTKSRVPLGDWIEDWSPLHTYVPTRKEILKAIVAAGILANPGVSPDEITYISHKVNEVYLALFGNNESH